MWTDCRIHSDFALFESATKFSIWGMGSITTNVKKTPRIEEILMSDERLCRMEDKLDKLSEAVVEMARMEERLLTIFKRLEHMDAAFKKYDDRVDEIEKQALVRE